MADDTKDMEHCDSTEALWSRRAVLKMIAGAPLVATFGLAASPLMRYLKPTMKPGNFFQAADFPEADPPPRFSTSDFSEVWTCLPFMLPLKYPVFNPQQYEIRQIPGFVIRTNKNEIVAFSRICPYRGCILNFRIDVTNYSCGCDFANHKDCNSGDRGCSPGKNKCSCLEELLSVAKAPILYCPCDWSVFDITDGGRVLRGPAGRPPRRLTVEHDGDWISITHIEAGSIA
jgi:Rieske Fe-S protein